MDFDSAEASFELELDPMEKISLELYAVGQTSFNVELDQVEKTLFEVELDPVNQTSFELMLNPVEQTDFEKSCWDPLPRGTYCFSDFIKLVDDYISKIHNLFNNLKENKVHASLINQKTGSSSKQLWRNITNSKSPSISLKCGSNGGQAKIPEVFIYYKNGETVCCINYHEDATSYYKNIVDGLLAEGLPDTSCSASEPPPFMGPITDITENFNFVEPVICPEDLFSDPFYQAQWPISMSDFELWKASNDTANAIASPSPESGNNTDIYAESFSLGATGNCVNDVYEHSPCFANERVAMINNTYSSNSSKQLSGQPTNSNKSASTLKGATERPVVINSDDHFSVSFHQVVISHSMPELMLPSTNTPAFLSVQSCEKLSAIEKEVEILRATRKFLPVYKHTSFFTKQPVTTRRSTLSSIMKPLRQSTNFDKSASIFKCMSEKLEKYGCIEADVSCEDFSNSLPDLMLASTTTPLLLSVQSCENYSAIEKKVEFLMANKNYLPDQQHHSKIRAFVKKMPSLLKKFLWDD